MTAVAEAPVAPDLNNFVMPRPPRGLTVLWHPHASKSDQTEIAYVTRVGHRNVVLNINGVARDSVPHIDDPRLGVNEHRRENGAWDFTDADRERADMKDRLAKLDELHDRLARELTQAKGEVCELRTEVAELKELFSEPAKKGK